MAANAFALLLGAFLISNICLIAVAFRVRALSVRIALMTANDKRRSLIIESLQDRMDAHAADINALRSNGEEENGMEQSGRVEKIVSETAMAIRREIETLISDLTPD